MVIASFLLQDKLEKIRFFQETFLVADTQIKVVFEILFLTFGNANIRFAERELVLKTYSATKALLTTWRVEIINKKKFATATLNEDDKTSVVHIAALSIEDSKIHLSQYAQIASR